MNKVTLSLLMTDHPFYEHLHTKRPLLTAIKVFSQGFQLNLSEQGCKLTFVCLLPMQASSFFHNLVQSSFKSRYVLVFIYDFHVKSPMSISPCIQTLLLHPSSFRIRIFLFVFEKCIIWSVRKSGIWFSLLGVSFRIL